MQTGRLLSGLVAAGVVVQVVGCASATVSTPPAVPGGAIVVRVASSENEDAGAAGAAAAGLLEERMGDTAPRVVLFVECFEDEVQKQRAFDAVREAFPGTIVVGVATYGSFSQEGCRELDAVSLLGIGGEGVAATAVLEESLGVAELTVAENEEEIRDRLHAAGERMARWLPRTPEDRLLIVLADAHSPKNGYLVEGIQKVLGPAFPVTGGSANKNAGQTFVYFGDRMYRDSAVALLLSGDFAVSLAGRRAQENAKVIATAREAMVEAVEKAEAKPLAVLAFDCAGRKGKLENTEDELGAMKEALGADIPLFGCYCAGEVGPADVAEAKAGVLSSGVGWHVMVTVLARE
jgi:hypothetical protein